MGDIVKGPMRFHHKRVITAEEIYRQQEPPAEMVWDMCVYTKPKGDHDIRCEACPRFVASDYGPVTPGCYVRASEACKLVSAWWMRDQWLKGKSK